MLSPIVDKVKALSRDRRKNIAAHRRRTPNRWNRVRVVRLGVLAVLLLVSAVSFIEVVALPGSVARGSEGTGTADPVTGTVATSAIPVAEAPPKALTPEQLFTSPQEQERLDEVRRKRMEKRLQEAQRRLGDAITAAESAVQSTRSELTGRFPGTTSQGEGRFPPQLASLLSTEPTARAAWADVTDLLAEADRALGESKSLHRLVSERFTGNAFLPEDEQEISHATQRLTATTAALGRVHSDINHLSVMLRAHAALARPQALTVPTGGVP